MVSNDGGIIWEKRALPFDPQEENVELRELTIGNKGQLILLTTSGLLTSQDRGKSWSTKNFKPEQQSPWHIIRNLHSGHFFGEWFIKVYDLLFMAILLLIVTGIVIWRIKEKRI